MDTSDDQSIMVAQENPFFSVEVGCFEEDRVDDRKIHTFGNGSREFNCFLFMKILLLLFMRDVVFDCSTRESIVDDNDRQ